MAGLLHGDSAAETVTAWAFVGVQAALLIAIVVLPEGDAWFLPAWADAVARALQVVGAVLLVVALANLGSSLNALPLPSPDATLRTGGLFRFVRHPIYAALLLLAWATVARSGSWVLVACAAGLTGLFAAKARYEEVKLRARYPDYGDYAARVPRFVPGPWAARRAR